MYEKQIQTAQVETEAPDAIEDKIRQQLIMQQHLEAERIAYEAALEEEAKKLDQEIEQEVRGWFWSLLSKNALRFSFRTLRGGTHCIPVRSQGCQLRRRFNKDFPSCVE